MSEINVITLFNLQINKKHKLHFKYFDNDQSMIGIILSQPKGREKQTVWARSHVALTPLEVLNKAAEFVRAFLIYTDRAE